ncbi:ABC transporter ATP-binding protein [Marinimicrococcus flavescens]|uniref:ABC transporter ATP-binding protein n=1 Tax=Marinimicrococcus flavescens TaxID=3031815 RepID=A0AAP3XPA1_9PROT|nr:ABC transporter ATP-binding protein [Marinimicrococcus flavescens]
MDLLRIEDLKVWFETARGTVRAVDGVTLSVRRGETLAVVGESGSGKSVTGLAVMRLLARTPARIKGGRILFRGKDGEHDLLTLSEARMAKLRGREIAMIFQDPSSSLNPVFTVGEQIAEAIVLHKGVAQPQALERAGDLLELVGIAAPRERLQDYPHQLSGGMRQRVMIAMALACDPLLLLADEPTTALDVTIQAQIVALLRRLQTERRMGMIFVAHDLGLVAEIADRVAVMYAGQVVEEGPVEGILEKPRHPYTLALMECSPHAALAAARGDGRTALRTIPGTPADPLDPPQGCRFHPRCRFAIDACRSGEVALRRIEAERVSRCLRAEDLA